MSGLQARGVARSGGVHGVPRGLRRLLIVGLVPLLLLLGLADAVAQRKGRGAPRKATEEQPAADASKAPPASTGTTEPARAAPPKGATEPPRNGTKPSQEARPAGGATTTAAPPGSEPAPPASVPPPTGPAPAVGPPLSPLNPEREEFPTARARRAPGDLSRLLSDIAALRSRVAALTAALFSSRIRVSVRAEGDDARIDSLAILLDDGVVFRAAERFVAEDDRVVFEHAVAPGQHVLGVEVERHDARGNSFRTWQSSRFSVVVPERKRLDALIVLVDDSEMADDFPEGEEGEYELGVTLEAQVAEQ